MIELLSALLSALLALLVALLVAPLIGLGLCLILTITAFIIEWIKDKIYSGFSFRRKRMYSKQEDKERLAKGGISAKLPKAIENIFIHKQWRNNKQ